MKNRLKSENGFSLIELAISVAIMGIMMTTIMITAVPMAIGTAEKTNIRNDVTALSIELQGWHMSNPDTEPSAFEWEQMKLRVLEDKVDTDLMYLQNITFVKLGNYYCVEATSTILNEEFITHFYGSTGKYLDEPCPVVEGKEASVQ